MKFLFTTCLVACISFNGFSQKAPKTLADLSQFIGLDCSRVKSQMDKKGYSYDADYDESEAGFTWKSFDSKSFEYKKPGYHEITLICDDDDEKVIGVEYEFFTETDYANIVTKLRSDGFKKTISGKRTVNIGLEKADLWVSPNKKFQVRIDYSGFIGEEPKKADKVTISTDVINWGLDREEED